MVDLVPTLLAALSLSVGRRTLFYYRVRDVRALTIIILEMCSCVGLYVRLVRVEVLCSVSP